MVDALGEQESREYLEPEATATPVAEAMPGPGDEPPAAGPIEMPGAMRTPPHRSLMTLAEFFREKDAEINFADEEDCPFDGEAVFPPGNHIFVFNYFEKPSMRDAIDFYNSLLASRAIFGFMITGEPEPDLRVFSVGKDMAVIHSAHVTADGKHIMEAID
jgi:hypothetical protein